MYIIPVTAAVKFNYAIKMLFLLISVRIMNLLHKHDLHEKYCFIIRKTTLTVIDMWRFEKQSLSLIKPSSAS